MNQLKNIPIISLSGTAKERGISYGVSCKELIIKNIEFYKKLITLPEEKRNEHAVRFAKNVSEYNPELKIEMDAIAEGAEVNPLDIYMINARTEMLALIGIVHSECSTFFFPKMGILFENWDWLEDSKELVVVLSITMPNGNKILTFTEAGIVGKIGISSKGFGIAFNYLFPEPNNGGIPVHILLRTLLEADSYEDAQFELTKEHLGTSGNIILASFDGKSIDVELSGKSTYVINGNTVDPLVHTNHYIGGAENIVEGGSGFLDNSYMRVARINDLLATVENQTVSDAKNILSDRKEGHGMLCRDFLVEDPGDGKTGTVASIIMDLRNQTLHFSLLPQNNSTYETVSIDN